MDKKIVIINGTGGSGKDTFIEYASKYAKVMNFSSIDKVKEIATLIGWNGEKTEKARKFLSDLKKLTTDFNDMPLNSLKEKVEEFNNSDDEILFLHIREPEEILRAVKEFYALTLLIKREGLENIQSNISDSNVDNYNYDYIIINDTLYNLDIKAKQFVKKLVKSNK